MTTRAVRLARGWLVGVFAATLAALSHTVAGGGLPSPLAIAVGTVFGGLLGTFALTARPSFPRLAVAVTVTQAAFHVGFSLLGTATATDAVAGHAHDVAVTATAVPHPHGEPLAMWIAHAVAGALTLALLRGAERAVWRALTELVRLVVAPFRLGVAALVASPAPRAPQALPRRLRLAGRLLVSAASRRGPPLLSAF